MPTPRFTIAIPTNAEEKVSLAELVYAKHLLDGEQSPLHTMKTNKWDTSGPAITEALALHKRAEELSKQMVKAYADRDSVLENITITLKASREILLGIYSQSPRDIGEWGFDVHEVQHHSSGGSNKAPEK